jgi:hypothetical protein
MRKIIVTLMLFVLTGCATVQPPAPTASVFRTAVNYKGYDVLGLARQDTKMIAREARPGTVLGVLHDTFGDEAPKVREMIADHPGKFVAIRAHCRDGTCVRNKSCAPGTPSLNNMPVMAECAREYNSISQDTGVPCWLSPVLEHDEKDKNVVQTWINTLRSNAPLCGLVQNPFSGTTVPGVIVERHGGKKASGSIISTDGVSLYDVDTRTWWNQATGFSLGWINRFNLRLSGEKGKPPFPKDRPLKNRATVYDMQLIGRLMEPVTPQTPWPSVCRNRREIKSPEVLKSNAEDYANGDPRANKLVFLTKFSGSQFDIINSAGRKVACLKRYSPSLDGLNRYYLGSCSPLNNIEVMDKAGSEWVFFRNGSTCYRGNAIRRLGTWRES